MVCEKRQIIIKALLKLAQSAPIVKIETLGSCGIDDDIEHLNFEMVHKIWLDYVYSVLDITYNETKLNCVLARKIAILKIANQSSTCEEKTMKIKDEILNLVQEFLK